MKDRFIYGYLTSGVCGEKTRVSKWCALTRLLNEGPVQELVIALRIMSLIISVSLWPLSFSQRAFLLGRAWRCSFSFWQWTLCAGCALFTLQQFFTGSTWHLAREAQLIHVLPAAVSPLPGSCSACTRARAVNSHERNVLTRRECQWEAALAGLWDEGTCSEGLDWCW